MRNTSATPHAVPAVRFDALPDVLTPDEVAAALNIRCRRASALVRTLERDGLPVRRVNRRLRVLKSDLIRYLVQEPAGPAPGPVPRNEVRDDQETQAADGPDVDGRRGPGGPR